MTEIQVSEVGTAGTCVPVECGDLWSSVIMIQDVYDLDPV